MSIPRQTYEIYPTDIRFLDSFCEAIIDISSLVSEIKNQETELRRRGTYPQESLLLTLWMVRRALREIEGVTVIDLTENSDYEEMYSDLLATDCLFISMFAKRILIQKDFKPTAVQVIITNRVAVCIFGASDVTVIEKFQQRKSR